LICRCGKANGREGWGLKLVGSVARL